MAVGVDGRLHVTDMNNSRVQVYDVQGKHITALCPGNIAWAGREGQFKSPAGIAVSGNYLALTSLHQVPCELEIAKQRSAPHSNDFKKPKQYEIHHALNRCSCLSVCQVYSVWKSAVARFGMLARHAWHLRHTHASRARAHLRRRRSR